MSTVLFIVGPPGAGKTSIVRTMLGPGTTLVSKPKWTLGNDICAVGHYTGSTFDGGDTVPYNGVRNCLSYWYEHLRHNSITIFDGDRFSIRSVIDFFSEQDVSMKAIHVSVPTDVLEHRRASRGSNQNPIWIKGRVTKARRFADMLDHIDINNISVVQSVIDIWRFIYDNSRTIHRSISV